MTYVYIVSVYLDESTGSCRPVELSDDLEEKEVRDKQLLGIDMGEKKIFIIQMILYRQLLAVGCIHLFGEEKCPSPKQIIYSVCFR